MDDLASDFERKITRALDLITKYEEKVVTMLAEEIIRYEDDFKDTATPLQGSAPGILEKYYGVLNSISVAKRHLRGKC